MKTFFLQIKILNKQYPHTHTSLDKDVLIQARKEYLWVIGESTEYVKEMGSDDKKWFEL